MKSFEIERLVAKHNEQRLNALNLIVSENRMSPRAMAPLASDLHTRYAAEFYAGTEPARNIITICSELSKTVFRAKHANLSPVSGSVALLSAIFALSKPGDEVGRVPPFFPGGGYPLNYAAFDRRPLPLPFSEVDWQLDLKRTIEVLKDKRPPLVVLGSSIFTHPMPVREIADVVHDYNGLVIYDGSHSLGLIAGGQYQDPLREGADLLLGSTHKTFPGPQGGLIVTNNSTVHEQVERLSNFTPLNGPTMTCNPHLARIASTAIVLEETPWHQYAAQVVENARTLASALRDEGIPMHGILTGELSETTYCHQVVTNFPDQERTALREHFFRHRINVDGFVRIGVSEITRLGFRKTECLILSKIISQLVRNPNVFSPEIKLEVERLVQKHSDVVL